MKVYSGSQLEEKEERTEIGLETIMASRLICLAPGLLLPEASARFCPWITVAI